MTIEVHEPELEALIQKRMESGRFGSIERVLLAALKASPDVEEEPSPKPAKPNLVESLKESPLWNSGLKLERSEDRERVDSTEMPGRKNLAELFAESPFSGLDLEFARDNEPLRPVDL